METKEEEMKLAERMSDELLVRLWLHMRRKIRARGSAYTSTGHYIRLAKSSFGKRTFDHCANRTELWKKFEDKRREE